MAGALTGLGALDASLEAALTEVRRAGERVYYDEAGDATDRAAYWGDLAPAGDGAAFYGQLHTRLAETHTRPQSYQPAQRLYPWVDLQPDRTLTSIYSGRGFDPEQLIREDMAIQRRIEERLVALGARGADPSRLALARIEAEEVAPFNCEHSVPQSWFNKHEPMRGDLHHLFTCEVRCNSFRGNDAYFDFGARRDATRPDCGRLADNAFEPLAGKGQVARATLYFLVRYPALVQPGEMPAERLAVLLAWHVDHPVTEYERHRNAAIAAVQGNRNPFIDAPAWTDNTDFGAGFGA